MAQGPDMMRSAQKFATGLESPFQPSLCPTCFTLFASSNDAEERIALLLKPKGHPFWTALMIFVTSDWNSESQDKATKHLLRASIRCRTCKPARHLARLSHQVPEAESFFSLVFQISCSLLEGALINEKSRYKGFGKKPERWPTTPEQLFPRGPERTITCIISQMHSHSLAQVLLERLIQFHRHLVFPILLQPEHRAQIIDCVTTRLTVCVSRATAALDSLRRPDHPGSRNRVQKQLMKESQPSSALLFIILCSRDCQVDERLRFCHRREADLFSALHAVACLVLGEDDHLLFTHLASQLWCLLSEPQRDAVGCPAPPEYGTRIHSLEILDDPYHALEYYLSLRATRRDCAGPDCHEKAPTPLSRCARCRTVQYCSRACQKADWTSGEPIPHRDICDMLQELGTFARVDRGMGPDVFAAACVEHAFPLDRVDAIISWATRGSARTNYATGGESKHHMHDPLIVVEKTNCTPTGGFEFTIKSPAFAKGRDITEQDVIETAEKLKVAMKSQGYAISWRVESE